MLPKIIYLCLLVAVSQPRVFRFQRTVECNNATLNSCLNWAETTLLTQDYSFFSCFSRDTYVQTQQGPLRMDQLSIGDQLLGINPSSGELGYSPITAWLHHDPRAISKFTRIHTKWGIFQSSPLHNLGYLRDGKIDYKFAHNFSSGDQLIGFPHEVMKVSSVEDNIQGRGLFAPYTQFRNYFVFESEFLSAGSEKSMVLAHSLSQVKNPQNKRLLTSSLIWGTKFLAGEYQPRANQIYTHPILTNYYFLYGNSWIHEQRQVTHELVDSDHSSLPPSTSHMDFISLVTSYQDDSRQRQNRKREQASIITSIQIQLNSILL